MKIKERLVWASLTKMKDIVNPKDIDEGYEDDEYVFDDNGAADNGTSYDNAYNGYSGRQITPRPARPVLSQASAWAADSS